MPLQQITERDLAILFFLSPREYFGTDMSTIIYEEGKKN